MVKYDFKSRLKCLDLQLFPSYIEEIKKAQTIEREDWYVNKMLSNTDKLVNLPDCNEDELREVFSKYMKELIEILKVKHMRRIQ